MFHKLPFVSYHVKYLHCARNITTPKIMSKNNVQKYYYSKNNVPPPPHIHTPPHSTHTPHTHTHTHTQDSSSPHSSTTRLSSAVGASTSLQAISMFLRETNNSYNWNWVKTTSLMWRSIDGHHCLMRPLWTSMRSSTCTCTLILKRRSQVGVVYS